MFNLKRFLTLGLVGFIILIGWWLQGAIWDFVTTFILALVGETFAFVIGLALWFVGLAFLAMITIWIVKRFGSS